LTLLGIVRELLGTGCFFGHSIIGGADGMLMMILPPGGFLALGFLMAWINHLRRRKVKNS
jgi:electron transport complex protein RnfE